MFSKTQTTLPREALLCPRVVIKLHLLSTCQVLRGLENKSYEERQT